jgi:hypothetical protein
VTELHGAGLAEAFHRDVVAGLIQRTAPGLRYAAARLGSGSDVLGFDDPTSRDHDWGCRLTVLVDEADAEAVGFLEPVLEHELPRSFAGYPVRFATTWDPAVTHKVHLATVYGFAAGRLGVDPRNGLSQLEWLSLTGHSVLETVGGPVFHDETVELARLRGLLRWYPESLEPYLLAAGWQRLAQTMPFVGRTADTGQERQSVLLSGQLVRDLMRLAFLMERQWAPYSKWFEAGFARLSLARPLSEPLDRAATAKAWREREDGLVAAVEVLAQAQRERGLPTPDRAVVPFWDRPYQTVSEDLVNMLGDWSTGMPLVGSIEQWVDNDDILARPHRRPALVAAYRAWLSDSDGNA